MQFGCGAITRALFDDIRFMVPDGSHILEFGSGRGTKELLKHYKVTSVFPQRWPKIKFYIYTERYANGGICFDRAIMKNSIFE